jgi:phosphate transport system permease protein
MSARGLRKWGVALGSDVAPGVLEAAKSYREFDSIASSVRNVVVIIIALAFAFWAWSRITPKMRARNITETFIKALLMGSSLVAILTTVGIVASLLFESLQFFQLYPAKDFLLLHRLEPAVSRRLRFRVSAIALGYALRLLRGRSWWLSR